MEIRFINVVTKFICINIVYVAVVVKAPKQGIPAFPVAANIGKFIMFTFICDFRPLSTFIRGAVA